MGTLLEWTRDVLSNFVVMGSHYSEWRAMNKTSFDEQDQDRSIQENTESNMVYSWNYLPDGSLDASHFISEYEKTHITDAVLVSNIEGTEAEQLLSSLQDDLASSDVPVDKVDANLESLAAQYVLSTHGESSEDGNSCISFDEADVLSIVDLKRNNSLNIPQEFVDKYTTSTIEASVDGEHTWVCQVVGKHDCYLHVNDGSSRDWVKVSLAQSQKTETGNIIILKISISEREKKVLALGLIEEREVIDIR